MAASERAAANTKRAKAEVDVSDLQEQISKHEQTQVSLDMLCIHWRSCHLFGFIFCAYNSLGLYIM